MVHPQSRTRRMISRHILMFVLMLGLLFLAAPGVAAYPADGPQLLVDRLVLPPGVPVTLNQFPATQPVILHVRPSLRGDQGVSALAFPGTTDAIGSGAVVIPRTSFSPGNAIISVTTEGSPGDLDGVLTAFAIVDAGFPGPRIVRAEPLPQDDQG